MFAFVKLPEPQSYTCTNFIFYPVSSRLQLYFRQWPHSRTYQGFSKELAPLKINEPETEHPISIRCHLVGRAEQGDFSQRTRLEENVVWRDGVVYPPYVMEPIE